MRAATEIPELAGPGTAHPDGLVTYGQTATLPAPADRLPDAPPESLGPAVESSGGAFSYGQPGPRCGPMPIPTQAERELRERLTATCQYAVIPDGVIVRLAELATAARLTPREGTGCPRCRVLPQRLVDRLAEAIGTGAAR
jgi:hypothetical protein